MSRVRAHESLDIGETRKLDESRKLLVGALILVRMAHDVLEHKHALDHAAGELKVLDESTQIGLELKAHEHAVFRLTSTQVHLVFVGAKREILVVVREDLGQRRLRCLLVLSR